MRITDWPSPNFGPRADGVAVDILLLHYTGMPSAEAARDWLCDSVSNVSCHYFVHEDGRVLRLVGEEHRAWHGGAGNWRGCADINSRAIGIEIVNPGHDHGYRDFPDAQMAAVGALCADILSRHPIPARNVLAHSDTAPGRKIDPGEKFDWARLHAAGIGHWVAPAPITDGSVLGPGDEGPEVQELQTRLRSYGYGIDATGTYDSWTTTVVEAFQRHFRQACVDGLADRSTRDTLGRLIDALPTADPPNGDLHA